MKTYHYIPNIWDKDELDVEDAYEFDSHLDIYAVNQSHKYDDIECQWLVEEMANDYFSNHDGWDSADSWSRNAIVFALWDSEKNFVGKFTVTLEFEPTFSAYKEK